MNNNTPIWFSDRFYDNKYNKDIVDIHEVFICPICKNKHISSKEERYLSVYPPTELSCGKHYWTYDRTEFSRYKRIVTDKPNHLKKNK